MENKKQITKREYQMDLLKQVLALFPKDMNVLKENFNESDEGIMIKIAAELNKAKHIQNDIKQILKKND